MMFHYNDTWGRNEKYNPNSAATSPCLMKLDVCMDTQVVKFTLMNHIRL